MRDGPHTLPISHGLCEVCLAQQLEALDETVSECADTEHSKVKPIL
jgi:hypothetical protein